MCCQIGYRSSGAGVHLFSLYVGAIVSQSFSQYCIGHQGFVERTSGQRPWLWASQFQDVCWRHRIWACGRYNPTEKIALALCFTTKIKCPCSLGQKKQMGSLCKLHSKSWTEHLIWTQIFDSKGSLSRQSAALLAGRRKRTLVSGD